jgi:hypothetical protein
MQRKYNKQTKLHIKKGDMVFTTDLKDNLAKVSTLVSEFGTISPDQIAEYIRNINGSLTQSGQQANMGLSVPVMDAMKSVHETILKQIKQSMSVPSTMSTANADKMAREKMAKTPFEDLMKMVSEEFGKDVEAKKVQVIQSLNLGTGDNKLIVDPLTNIFDTIKELKVRYRFFEYKYIELNVFMLLFVQHVYTAMSDFTTQVLAINKLREEDRQNIMREGFVSINKTLKESGVTLEPVDYNNMQALFTNLQQKLTAQDREMRSKMDGLMQITTDNMSEFVGALSKSTLDSMLAAGKSRQGQTGQQGGFVRGQSQFPQAFYDLGGDTTS